MPLKTANNAHSTLVAGINAGALSFTVQSGHGARFPTLGAGDFMILTFINASNAIEVVKVTARTDDVFTIPTGGRGFDGSSAQSWLAGDLVELRYPRIAIDESIKIGGAENTVDAGGTVDALTATIDTVNKALFDWFEIFVAPAGPNATTTPTINVTLGSTATGAIAIVRPGGNAPAPGDLSASMLAHLRYDMGNNKWVLMNPNTASAPGGSANSVLRNGYLDATVGGGVITASLKTVANDAAPSASDTIGVSLRDETITVGSFNNYSIAAAVQDAVSSGSTMGCGANEKVRIHYGLMRNAGSGVELFRWTAVVAAKKYPYKPDFTGFVTTLQDAGGGTADTAQQPYSNTARTGQPCIYIGYIEATSGATPGVWASINKIVNYQNGMPMPGDVVNEKYEEFNTVDSTTNPMPVATSLPPNTDGKEFFTSDYTAQSTLNIVEREARGFFSVSAVDGVALMALYFDAGATAIALDIGPSAPADGPSPVRIVYRAQAGSVAAVTARLRAGMNVAGTLYFNRSSGVNPIPVGSNIHVKEYHA